MVLMNQYPLFTNVYEQAIRDPSDSQLLKFKLRNILAVQRYIL